MQVIKTLETNNHTYYCGYISKYERSKAEQKELRYMIIQKLIGVLAIILAALSLIIVKIVPEFGLCTILMALMGIILTLTNKHAISIGGY